MVAQTNHAVPTRIIRKAAIFVMAFAIYMGTARPVAAKWIDGQEVVLQGLDKITARITTLTTPINESLRFGTLELIVNHCAFHPPEETPENVAFMTILDRGHDPSREPKPVFTGWMFASSPAVSAMEHPVYDIILLTCVAK